MATILETMRLPGLGVVLPSTSASDWHGWLSRPQDHQRAVLAIEMILSIGLIALVCADLVTVQFAAALIIVGQARTREAYRLNVLVDPKINAFLLMEKARTGKTIAEIVETIFKEYQRHRKEAPPSRERRKD